MVRETRHLWVGNLPDNIREDRIREHFKRYGRVQSVKVLARGAGAGAGTVGAEGGTCAAVAFMDIKSAAKAHNSEKVLEERAYTTEYYEPAAIPSTASAGSSPAGSGYSASSGSVSSRYHEPPPRHPVTEEGGSVAAAVGSAALAGGAAAAAAGAAAGCVATWRGTNDSADRGDYRRGGTPAYCAPAHYRRGPHPPAASPAHRWHVAGEASAPSTPGAQPASSRSSSSEPEPSSDSRASTPRSRPVSQRPLAICVRNLPARSSDSSLKDGLYHEYKKHGKVAWVKVVGANSDRYAVVRFKKPSDVEKALEVSQDKLFFGCKISVAPHQGSGAELEDGEPARPYETDLDENHPKATRTLFIGNLEKDVTAQQLRDKFKTFGRIIEIDVKKQTGGAGYAFCQYATISAVVEAIRAMDGEYVGSSRVKLGFGKSMATACVWIDGLTEHAEKQVLGVVARCGAATAVCVDRSAGAALVHFEQAAAAAAAVRELRRLAAAWPPDPAPADRDTRRLLVDFASRDCQDAFYEQLEKHGGGGGAAGAAADTARYARHDSLSRYEAGTGAGAGAGAGGSCRARAASYGRSSSRSRSGRLPPPPDHYDLDYPRYRVYDEFGCSSPGDLEGTSGYEESRSLQSVVVASPRRRQGRHHRRRSRDSTPDDLNKERHRSTGASKGLGDVRLRSPSNSRRRRTSEAERRRHRRRREDSTVESRSGTPLRDELPEGPAPADPRCLPVHRDRVIMTLPLPKFAENYLMRNATSAATPASSTAAPASPPRAPSASSSSGGSAPHSPSLEERIRSLDEKYEKWSGSRAAAAEAAERGRFRHRLFDLELDMKEVKPSDVAKSFLTKRSIFDEDTERLEGAAAIEKRCTSPSSGSPKTREQRAAPRALQYPFPTHPPPPSTSLSSELSFECDERVPPNGTPARCPPREPRVLNIDTVKSEFKKSFVECSEVIAERDNLRTLNDSALSVRSDNPHVNRTDCLSVSEKQLKPTVPECKRDVQSSDSGIRERSSSTDKSHLHHDEKQLLEKTDRDRTNHDRDPRREVDKIRFDNNLANIGEKITADENVRDCTLEHESSTLKENTETREEKIDNEIIGELCSNVIDLKENSAIPLPEVSVSVMDSNTNPQSEEINNTNKDNDNIGLNSNNDVESTEHTVTRSCIMSEYSKEDSKEHSLSCNITDISYSVANIEETINKENTKEKLFGDEAQSEIKPNNCDNKKEVESQKHTSDTVKQISQQIMNVNSKEFVSHDHLAEISKVERVTGDMENDKGCIKRKEQEKSETDKSEREHDRKEDKIHKHEIKRERSDKDKRRDDSSDNVDAFNHVNKSRKDDKHKTEKSRKDHSELRRESKKEKDTEAKPKDVSRKSSRDETSREIHRKDSSDSSTSRNSHESTKYREIDILNSKENNKHSGKYKHSSHDNNHNKSERDSSHKNSENKKADVDKHNHDKNKETKSHADMSKEKTENHMDKPRHYSVDSVEKDVKKKERLLSSSSLPANISQKRRLSSQDVIECMIEESKKARIENRIHERRDSKDHRPVEKNKAPKFNKCHFAKLLESKIKDDKKNQVKMPDDKIDEWNDTEVKENKYQNDKIKLEKKCPKNLFDGSVHNTDIKSELDIKPEPSVSPRGIEFLATLELRSSEEDEKQKAIRKEMKERKRIQQLQQIQQLQMQQDLLQQGELHKLKEEKKIKDEKKKEAAREKRMSTERKSREDRIENKKKQQRTGNNSSDTSDSDEPKKHSIFDIVDDGPTYISMYDKVKARSCKNMQKQEEEKRQEKIKAKFSQLKQSRAKREEKKRSTSWDEDSDSDHDRKKFSHKYMVASSSEDERNIRSNRRESYPLNDYDINKIEKNCFYDSTHEEDQRNKLSRKNSRSRIVSDTSDDDSMKRHPHNKIENNIDVKKEILSDNESHTCDYLMVKRKEIKRENYTNSIKEELDNKFTKNLNKLFDENSDNKQVLKMKMFEDCLEDKKSLKNILKTENSHIKATDLFLKNEQALKASNDFSSEGEYTTKFSMSEIRKKHKKKQKKQKWSLSEDDTKSTDFSEQSPVSREVKHRRNSEKSHKHGNRKERRREKTRDSLDNEEICQDKLKNKKGKKCSDLVFDNKLDIANSLKRDEKMENIFGPLSDESDTEPASSNTLKPNNYSSIVDLPTAMSNDKLNFLSKNINDFMTKDKEKEESRRRKEKKRKEKRFINRDDENSLDVDAAGKAIEASLFADSVSENDINNISKSNSIDTTTKCELETLRYSEDNMESSIRVETKEKKKKKKKNKDDRQSRHYHHPKSDIFDKFTAECNLDSDSPHVINVNSFDKEDTSKMKEEIKSNLQSPSLPRLTDSPPPLLNFKSNEPIKESTSLESEANSNTNIIEISDEVNLEKVQKSDCKSPPMLSESPQSSETRKTTEKFIPGFGNDIDDKISENAVKSIAEFDKQIDHKSDSKLINNILTKPEEKNEDKPRAVISQEETEDAVAALLGESFGGNDSFVSCFDEVEENTSVQQSNASIENEIIPEEDAEEMRQAVQNLNASELDTKPETPLSENDLQIDTDTEDLDDAQQESPEKVVVTPTTSAAKISMLNKKLKVSEATGPMNSPANKITTEPVKKTSPLRRSDTVSECRMESFIPPTNQGEFQQITPTTPVISTTWTLSGNKLREHQTNNVHANHIVNRDEHTQKLTANIVQLKPQIPQNAPHNTQPRGIIGTQTRMTHPYVINQLIRPGHVANLQPPTIKIPEHHIMYQKQGNVVISPRMTSENRLQSPKSSPQSDASSPRMTILSPTGSGLGLASPTAVQQRSPGHVTVVRMQQPQLSPLQTMHLSHGPTCRTMVSPSRPSTVLVQTQPGAIHINRMPGIQGHASLPKPIHISNSIQSPKSLNINSNTAILHPQKIITEIRKTDARSLDMAEPTKFLLSPANLPPSTNPTVMAQNRLMQNAGIHMGNKILYANPTHLSENVVSSHIPYKQDISKLDTNKNKHVYAQSPIIHIAAINQSSASGHNIHKPMLNQEQFNIHRPAMSNVIHSVNSQRLLTTIAMPSVIQGERSKPISSSVLSMAPVRPPSGSIRFEKSNTTSVMSNVVMTPVMIKANVPCENKPHESQLLETRSSNNATPNSNEQRHFLTPPNEDKFNSMPVISTKITMTAMKEPLKPPPTIPTPPSDNKCETDFEELLKSEININANIGNMTDIHSKKEIPASLHTQLPLTNDALKAIEIKSTQENLSQIKVKPESADSKASNDIKEDIDTWSAKDINIESVIKKVDDLCDSEKIIENEDINLVKGVETKKSIEVPIVSNGPETPETPIPKQNPIQSAPMVDVNEQPQYSSKRGGRTARGKKVDKQQDRVQTRQISKPARGATTSRRGRGGRAKMEKKVKSAVNSGPLLSGDVYDFHDDSGDETQASARNKAETRPRLILTIKSPLTSSSPTVTASSLITSNSVTPKDQNIGDKPSVQTTTSDKNEDFLSPAPNTRKSRRLLEKDGNRSTVDEVIEDVVKNSSPIKSNTKDGRRSTRQATTKSQDKSSEVRKSPRGGKRMRDRSSSETSIDSSDEKSYKKDDATPPDAKVPKLSENITSNEKSQPVAAPVSKSTEVVSSSAAVTPAISVQTTMTVPQTSVTVTTSTVTPIMKPPKKMISEISAKLGSHFDTLPIRPHNPVVPKEPEHTPTVISGADKPLGTEAAGLPIPSPIRIEKIPGMPDARMGHLLSQDVPVRSASFAADPPLAGRGVISGVVEEADLRVQSPALPHRPPPLPHRQPDRATPILIRSGESEALEACRASPARAGAVGGVGPAGAGSRSYRASFDPSLPRGAHHPPPPPASHSARAPPLKHVAVVGPQPGRLSHAALSQGSPQGSITSELVRSPPPAHQQTSPVTPGEGMYPHFSHQHYQVYQQHFRATQQDMRASPSPYARSPREAEGSEAPTPPLELRRPPPSARVPRPAHSPSLADRIISGRGSPPPAHGGSGARLPSALPPLGPPGPPHASQVPREADSLQMLLQRYPVMWQGLLALKNDGAAVQMHFVHGNAGVAERTLPRRVDGSTPPLRIAQRMRLEPVQLEAVHRKMQMENEHCMLLALPCGRDHMDVLQQSTNLTAGFITYLQRKQAAGIVNVALPGHHQAMYTVHIFPSCEFANDNLNRIAPDLLHRVADIAHLLIVIATV